MKDKITVNVLPLVILLKHLEKLKPKPFDVAHYAKSGNKKYDYDVGERPEAFFYYQQLSVDDYGGDPEKELSGASGESMHLFLVNRFKKSDQFDCWAEWSINAMGFSMFAGKAYGSISDVWNYIFGMIWPSDPELAIKRILNVLGSKKDSTNYGKDTLLYYKAYFYNKVASRIELDFKGMSEKNKKYLASKLKGK
jgi:hypothetical protein